MLGFFEEYGPNLSEAGIVAVGHRVVQGGSIFPKPALVTNKTINQVKDLAVLAPLHNGPEAKAPKSCAPCCRTFRRSSSSIPPSSSSCRGASTYALNKEIADQYHIRRYAPTAPPTSTSPPWCRTSSASRLKAEADRFAHRQRRFRFR